MRNFLIGLIFLLSSVSIFSQTGIVRGDIFNSMTAEPVNNISITVEGSDVNQKTDLDGNFNLELSPGVYTIILNDPSFEKKMIAGVEVLSGEVNYLGEIFIDEAFMTEDHNIVLEGLTVQADLSKNTETALLTMKRKSAIILDGISSAKMELAGDGNAVEAAKRVTGVSVEGGKYVYIRGLGDRYSKTTLNGFDIPGLDPDRNTIQMDIFPTNLLDNVMVSKNFTADQPADFTGGILNIETKDFPNKKFMSISAGIGFNPDMHLKDDYLTYDGGDLDFLGIDDGTRNLPSLARNSSLPGANGNNPSQEYLSFMKSFNNELAPKEEKSLLNYDVSFSMGDQISLKSSTNENRKQLGYVFSLTYKNNTEYFDDIYLGEYRKIGDPNQLELSEEKSLTGRIGINNTLLGVLGGLAYKTNNSKYRLNLMHLQNGTKSTSIYDIDATKSKTGLTSQFKGVSNNLDYNQKSLSNLSLRGTHLFKDSDWEIEWGVAPTLSLSKDPDVRKTAFESNGSSLYFNAGGAGMPQRLWRYLEEFNVGTKVDATKEYVLFNKDAKLKFGLNHVYKTRDSEILSISIRFPVPSALPNWSGDPNQVLSDELINKGLLEYVSGNGDPNPNEYQANSNNFAAYVSNEFILSEKLKTILGLRLENFVMKHTGRDQSLINVLDNETVLESTDLFPSVNFIYAITDRMNLRASYTRTIARPSFKEMSFATILDPVSQRTFNGGLIKIEDWNGNLQATNINNIDLRWEYFLSRGQMLSFSAFYKTFDKPIEMVLFQKTSGFQYQPQNVGDGKVIGIELEFRKNLGFISPNLENLSLSSNLTIADSEVKMSDVEYQARVSTKRADEEVSREREMAGQAPYVINAGIVYNAEDFGLETGLFYNVQGSTLSFVGSNRPDIYTEPFHNLNFSFMKKINNSSITLQVSNLLGEKMEEVFRSWGAKDALFESRQPGRTFSIGYKYNF